MTRQAKRTVEVMTWAFADDWARLCRRPPTESLAGWAATEPCLAGASLEEVKQRAQASSVDLVLADRTMAALFRLAPGDPVARRVALEAVLPRLVRAAPSLTYLTPLSEVIDDLAAAAWEEVGVAAGRWTTHLTARLATHVARRHRQAHRYQQHETPAADLDPDSVTAHPGPDLDRTEVAALLHQAVADGVIGPAPARALHGAAAGLTDTEIAAWLGVSAAAAKKARQRGALALRSHGPVLALLAG